MYTKALSAIAAMAMLSTIAYAAPQPVDSKTSLAARADLTGWPTFDWGPHSCMGPNGHQAVLTFFGTEDCQYDDEGLQGCPTNKWADTTNTFSHCQSSDVRVPAGFSGKTSFSDYRVDTPMGKGKLQPHFRTAVGPYSHASCHS